MTSRVPFTRANLQFYTGLERAKLERKLDELVRGGVLDIDSDDAGEPVWSVVGADRPARGATQIADVVGIERLKGEGESVALAPLTKRGGGSFLPALVRGDGSKSILASGALSFFFGPLGWLYAAPLKDALPAVGIYIIIAMLLPHFLLAPLLGVLAPVSALAGVLYAWRFNQRGERTSLLPRNSEPTRSLPPRRK